MLVFTLNVSVYSDSAWLRNPDWGLAQFFSPNLTNQLMMFGTRVCHVKSFLYTNAACDLHPKLICKITREFFGEFKRIFEFHVAELWLTGYGFLQSENLSFPPLLSEAAYHGSPSSQNQEAKKVGRSLCRPSTINSSFFHTPISFIPK